MANVIFSKGSGENDSIFGKSQDPIKSIIVKGVEAFEEQSMIDKIFYMDTTENYAEKYATETSLGDFEDVGENGAYPKTSMQEGFSKTIEPTTWKSSFTVTQEMIEDAKIGKIKSRANIFTTSYGRSKEKHAAALLYGGTGASVKIGSKIYDTTSADKVPLFSESHPSVIKGNGKKQSNIFNAAFSAHTLDTAQELMQKITDDNGNLLSVSPDTIIIPNVGDLKRAIIAAVGSTKDAETSNNAINFQAGLWNVLVWNYLPSTIGGKPYFFLLDSKFKEDYECLPWVNRLNLTVKSDIDTNTDANIFKGRARFGAGFNNFRCIALCGEGVTGTVIA